MTWVEYLGNVAGTIFGLAGPFNPAAFLLSLAMSIGFAVYKGAILGYGLCPAIHTFLSIMMSTLISSLFGAVLKFTSPGGYSPESGLFKLILGAAVIFVTPFLAYSWAANFTMDLSSGCKTMFIDDLRDYLPAPDPLPPP